MTIQKLTLPRHMVELSPEDLERVRRENREMARLWTRDGPRRFSLPLGAPLDPLPAGGRFGHRRIINGSPRSPHGGADYSVADGTPVLAAADGTVAMVADQFFGGNAAFVDPGDGLLTMYIHMSRVDVAEGQAVRRGERVGAVGSTGRATGPHLHFPVRRRGARVGPAVLLDVVVLEGFEAAFTSRTNRFFASPSRVRSGGRNLRATVRWSLRSRAL